MRPLLSSRRGAVPLLSPAPLTAADAAADPSQVVVLPPVDGVVVVVLSGEVDLALAPELGAVRAWLDAEHLRVVVDASRVTFCDVAGWQALRSLDSAGTPELRDPSPAVRRLLDLLAGTDAVASAEG